MLGYEVHLRFAAPADRDAVMNRLRAFVLPDGQVIDDGGDTQIALTTTTTPDVALERALVILRAACATTDVPPEGVAVSTSAWPPSRRRSANDEPAVDDGGSHGNPAGASIRSRQDPTPPLEA